MLEDYISVHFNCEKRYSFVWTWCLLRLVVATIKANLVRFFSSVYRLWFMIICLQWIFQFHGRFLFLVSGTLVSWHACLGSVPLQTLCHTFGIWTIAPWDESWHGLARWTICRTFWSTSSTDAASSFLRFSRWPLSLCAIATLIWRWRVQIWSKTIGFGLKPAKSKIFHKSFQLAKPRCLKCFQGSVACER